MNQLVSNNKSKFNLKSLWRDILEALDVSYPEALAGKRVAVQEYGVSNPELLEGLKQRGAHVIPVPVYRWTMPDDLTPLQQLVV